ncbi:MAG: sigma-70 family RNA polymerase sigma factor [Phycisphaerae bacterium]
MITHTTTQLLAELRSSSGETAWVDFDARYRPVLQRFATQLGFASSDADELAQQTLTEFCRAFREGLYDPARGRLRSWLIGIARNVGHAMRRNRGAARVGGNSVLDTLPDEAALTHIWDEQREKEVFDQAMRTLRASSRMDQVTIQAFELYAIRGIDVDEVAKRCDMSVDTVYVIKNRLTKRLREIVAELTAAYEEGE